ncbi:MAG: CCA tRNA nucleotidyltransferase [Pseudomonadota bacterium]
MADFSLPSPFLRSPALRALLEATNQKGDTRVVGGAVRNAILGKPPGDVDLATILRPEQVAETSRAAGFSVYETGLSHGTLTVVVDGQPFEVTTLREDVATDGRRATVRFTESWAKDAHRRDFTMNALYVDGDGNGTDHVGGYGDCLAGRVRFIGDPVERILEDHLRIMRFFRFHALYGVGEPDQAGLGAVIKLKEHLADLAAERILHELTRLLAADRAAPLLAIIAEEQMLDPFIAHPLDVRAYRALCAAERAAGRPPTAALGLLSIVGFDVDAYGAMSVLLKFSRKLRNRGLAALKAAREMPPRSVPHVRDLLYRHGAEAFMDGLMVAIATGAFVADVPIVLQEARRWKRPTLPVGGDDLLDQGGAPGPALGERLNSLETLWRRSDFRLSREELLAHDRAHLDATG